MEYWKEVKKRKRRGFFVYEVGEKTIIVALEYHKVEKSHLVYLKRVGYRIKTTSFMMVESVKFEELETGHNIMNLLFHPRAKPEGEGICT